MAVEVPEVLVATVPPAPETVRPEAVAAPAALRQVAAAAAVAEEMAAAVVAALAAGPAEPSVTLQWVCLSSHELDQSLETPAGWSAFLFYDGLSCLLTGFLRRILGLLVRVERSLMGLVGKLHGLPGMLVAGLVIFFSMMDSCGAVRVSSLFVKFRGALMGIVRHGSFVSQQIP